MGVPYFKLKDIIKDNDITLFSSHFTLYRDVSRRVFSVLRDILDDVEEYSIDEAFFSIPESFDPDELSKLIKDTIEAKVGVPVSVGIASSKTQAKYAVELAKKTSGTKVLVSSEWSRLTGEIKLTELWGVGGKSTEHFRKAGYETVQDLIDADLTRVRTLFGVVGERLIAELKGESIYCINREVRDQKTIMSTRSFRNEVFELPVLEDAISYHVRHIAADLRAQNKHARVVRVSIRPSIYSDFLLQGSSLEAILDKPTNDTFTLLQVAQNLLIKAFKVDVPYKKAGVVMSGLVSTEIEQQTLFLDESVNNKDVSNKELLQIMDSLNTRADRELITVGDRRRGDKWQAKKDMVSPAYTTKWTDVALVKA